MGGESARSGLAIGEDYGHREGSTGVGKAVIVTEVTLVMVRMAGGGQSRPAGPRRPRRRRHRGGLGRPDRLRPWMAGRSTDRPPGHLDQRHRDRPGSTGIDGGHPSTRGPRRIAIAPIPSWVWNQDTVDFANGISDQGRPNAQSERCLARSGDSDPHLQPPGTTPFHHRREGDQPQPITTPRARGTLGAERVQSGRHAPGGHDQTARWVPAHVMSGQPTDTSQGIQRWTQ